MSILACSLDAIGGIRESYHRIDKSVKFSILIFDNLIVKTEIQDHPFWVGSLVGAVKAVLASRLCWKQREARLILDEKGQ